MSTGGFFSEIILPNGQVSNSHCHVEWFLHSLETNESGGHKDVHFGSAAIKCRDVKTNKLTWQTVEDSLEKSDWKEPLKFQFGKLKNNIKFIFSVLEGHEVHSGVSRDRIIPLSNDILPKKTRHMIYGHEHVFATIASDLYAKDFAKYDAIKACDGGEEILRQIFQDATDQWEQLLECGENPKKCKLALDRTKSMIQTISDFEAVQFGDKHHLSRCQKSDLMSKVRSWMDNESGPFKGNIHKIKVSSIPSIVEDAWADLQRSKQQSKKDKKHSARF